MTNSSKIIIAVIIIIIIGAVIHYKTKDVPSNEPIVTQEDSIQGCYVATLAKDVYTLNILSQEGQSFKGTLRFKNFEKDSSSGTYTGTYSNGILLGDYSFQSEGMDSVMQVIFKKTGEGFIRGYGDLDATGTRFTDINTVIYESNAVFKATPDCTSAAVVQGKLPAGSAPVASASAIQGKTWIWQKTVMNNDTVITPKKAGAFTLTLGADGKATGKTDCNSFFASYAIGTDGVIKFENIGSTKMFCEGSQESVFTGEIAQANHYMVDASGNLVLLLPMDSGSIMFTK
ncbi:MAG: META domain-containing protein [Patescibacteria group bacterium]